MIGTIIIGSLFGLIGFMLGFQVCASVIKKGYKVETKGINTISITRP